MTEFNFMGPHDEALRKIKDSIQETIIEDGLVKTGRMVRSVEHRQSGNLADEGQLKGEVGFFDEEVAVYAEALNHGTDVLPAYKFMERALDKTAAQARDDMADNIFKQIEKKLGW
ncbi:MAG: hypothetical protein ACYDG4_15135 [Desulfuromonadaceae bacterium]